MNPFSVPRKTLRLRPPAIAKDHPTFARKNNKALAWRRGLLFSSSYYLLEFAPVLVVQVPATLLMWVTLIEAWLAEAPPADALGEV